jgi:hypothetical protein
MLKLSTFETYRVKSVLAEEQENETEEWGFCSFLRFLLLLSSRLFYIIIHFCPPLLPIPFH